MLRRAPLLLAAGLFLVGVAGLFATTKSPGHTTPFVAPPRQQTQVTSLAVDPLSAASELPTGPSEAPLVASAASAHDAPPAALVSGATPTPTVDPRPPVVAAAVASDSTHELTPSPTPGAKLRTVEIGRDESPAPGP